MCESAKGIICSIIVKVALSLVLELVLVLASEVFVT